MVAGLSPDVATIADSSVGACDRRHRGFRPLRRLDRRRAPQLTIRPMAPRPPVEELTPQQAMEELAAARRGDRRREPRLPPGRRAADQRRRLRRAEAPQRRDRGRLPRAQAPRQPLRAGRRRALRDLLQGPPRGPDAPPRERLRRGGRPRVRHPHPPLPEPARGRAARLHRRAEDRRPLALAALRGRPPRRRRHPRRRRDRRERHRERPHHPRHPRTARRRARPSSRSAASAT